MGEFTAYLLHNFPGALGRKRSAPSKLFRTVQLTPDWISHTCPASGGQKLTSPTPTIRGKCAPNSSVGCILRVRNQSSGAGTSVSQTNHRWRTSRIHSRNSFFTVVGQMITENVSGFDWKTAVICFGQNRPRFGHLKSFIGQPFWPVSKLSKLLTK